MKVLNIRECKATPSTVIIDRSSKWGNPFRIGADGNRTEVIEKYRHFLWAQMSSDEFRESMLAELDGKDLVCWCAPAPCHGDVLVRAVAWLKQQ